MVKEKVAGEELKNKAHDKREESCKYDRYESELLTAQIGFWIQCCNSGRD